MSIQITYKKSESYDNNVVEVYANKAPIGTLSTTKVAPEQLCWSPAASVHSVAFQFRHEYTFAEVVDNLKKYKNEHGYKYLTIWTYNYGYATLLDKKVIENVGFKNLPDNNPACFFLE